MISLVTGGAGFIGAHVARELLALGHQVVVLDDLSGGFRDNVPPEAIFELGSINDVELVGRLFEQHRFDHVYHLAAYAAEGLSHFIKRFNYTNNLIGSVNLINEAVKHRVRCFVFTSSIAVYGHAPPPMTEEQAPQPADPYGIAKLAVEQELAVTHEFFGLDYIIFRPHNVYGEYQNLGDPYRNVVGIFMNKLMAGEPLTIFGDGSQTRAFSYIGDVAPHIARSVHMPECRGQVINIGADLPCTVNQLATEVMKAMGIEGPIQHLEPRNEVQNAHADHSKAKRLFGLQEPTPLADGLQRMARWARSVGSRRGQRFENIEVYDKLPPVWASL